MTFEPQRHWTPAFAGVTMREVSSPRRKPGSSVFAYLINAALALFLLSSAVSANATTLLQLSFEDLITNSELVFTGTVVDTTTTMEGDLVYTTVRFAVEDLILGETPNAFLELRFLGGTAAEVQTEVAGQLIPATGDHGVYFVDDTVRDMVNPLTGWSQGYFPLVDAADGSTWLDLKDHPDYDVLDTDADPLAGKMRSLGFTREQIAEKFPERFQYPLADFVAVIAALRAAQGD